MKAARLSTTKRSERSSPSTNSSTPRSPCRRRAGEEERRQPACSMRRSRSVLPNASKSAAIIGVSHTSRLRREAVLELSSAPGSMTQWRERAAWGNGRGDLQDLGWIRQSMDFVENDSRSGRLVAQKSSASSSARLSGRVRNRSSEPRAVSAQVSFCQHGGPQQAKRPTSTRRPSPARSTRMRDWSRRHTCIWSDQTQVALPKGVGACVHSGAVLSVVKSGRLAGRCG